MKQRFVIVTIDSLAELLKDYCGQEDLPASAQPIKLLLKPTEHGKLAILMESDEWKADMPPLSVNFQLKRIFTVGADATAS